MGIGETCAMHRGLSCLAVTTLTYSGLTTKDPLVLGMGHDQPVAERDCRNLTAMAIARPDLVDLANVLHVCRQIERARRVRRCSGDRGLWHAFSPLQASFCQTDVEIRPHLEVM